MLTADNARKLVEAGKKKQEQTIERTLVAIENKIKGEAMGPDPSFRVEFDVPIAIGSAGLQNIKAELEKAGYKVANNYGRKLHIYFEGK